MREDAATLALRACVCACVRPELCVRAAAAQPCPRPCARMQHQLCMRPCARMQHQPCRPRFSPFPRLALPCEIFSLQVSCRCVRACIHSLRAAALALSLRARCCSASPACVLARACSTSPAAQDRARAWSASPAAQDFPPSLDLPCEIFSLQLSCRYVRLRHMLCVQAYVRAAAAPALHAACACKQAPALPGAMPCLVPAHMRTKAPCAGESSHACGSETGSAALARHAKCHGRQSKPQSRESARAHGLV